MLHAVRRFRIRIALISAAGLLLVAVSGCGTGQRSAEPKVEAASPQTRPLADRFEILRGSPHPPSEFMLARVHARSPKLWRAYRAATPNGPLWLVSGPGDELCLFAGAPLENSCAAARSPALQRGITLGIVEHPAEPSKREFVLYGVVPDGQRTVRIKVGSLPPRTLRVRRGAFSFRAREPVNKL
jgi:hypothetical protein